MIITTITDFLSYFEKIRGRTNRLIERVPPEYIEWSPYAGRFTIGDQIRHIAAIERYMFAENVQGKPSRYPGCGIELAEGYEVVMQYFASKHEESIAIFNTLSDQDLLKKCPTPGNIQITAWKWLRAMTEHEIHHRGQIYVYLGLLGIDVPPLYGLTSEEVQKRST